MIRIGLNKDGAVCSWNCVAEAMSGFRREDALGLDFIHDLLDDEGQLEVAEPLSRARAGRLTRHINFPFFTVAKERVELSLFAVRCRMGAAEEGRAPDAEHIVLAGGLLTEDAPKRVSVDRGGHILDWGDEVARATGFGPGEVLGLAFVRDIVTRDLRNLVLQKLCQAFLGEPVPAFELPVLAKDATKKTFEVRLAADRAEGTIVGATFILTESIEEEIDAIVEKEKTSETSSACTPSASSGGTQDTLISYVHPSQDSLISYVDMSQDP